MASNIYYTPDVNEILSFMKTNVKGFDESLGYSKWHYVEGFVKLCDYQSEEHLKDKQLMRKLESAIFDFQREGYKDFKFDANEKRIRLSDKPTIFLYWHQGQNNLPELQELCYNRLLKVCSDKYDIRLLDETNVRQYIDIPEVIETAMIERRMWIQHFVDYIRMSLLSKYEGIWLDMTIFMKECPEYSLFDRPFWSCKNRHLFFDTWADEVIPLMNECQIYALGGTSARFFQAMKALIEYHFEKYRIAYSYYMMYYLADYICEVDEICKKQFEELPENNQMMEIFANRIELSLEERKHVYETCDTVMFKLLKPLSEDDNASKVLKMLKEINDE